jgi:hypothetical protein
MRLLGIEGGGTSWVVAISENDPGNIVERAEFDTVRYSFHLLLTLHA